MPGKKKPSVADQAIATLTELLDGLEAGKPLTKLATVRQVKVPFAAPPVKPADVRAVRDELGVSQAVFAGLIGASPATVRAWEQGQKRPSGMARRIIAEIRHDPAYWKKRVAEAVAL